MSTQRFWQNPIAWFMIAALMLGLIGFFIMGDAALDIPIHDTYFVVAHGHLALVAVLFCLGCSMIYWAFARVLRRRLNAKLGFAHALLTFVGLQCIFFPLHFIGLDGAPRRHYEYTQFDPVGESPLWTVNGMVTIAAAIFLVGQALFVFNALRTLFMEPQS